MDIQQLRQSLKIKWVSYYDKNRSWLVKAQIWSTYHGLRRPSSGFILATLSVLEPQLEEILPFILELNNNPDNIISALGLNFNPEEQLNLIKSDTFSEQNHVANQSCLNTLVSDENSDRSSTPQLQDDSSKDVTSSPSEDFSSALTWGNGDTKIRKSFSEQQLNGLDVQSFLHDEFPTRILVPHELVSSITLVTKHGSKSATKAFSGYKPTPFLVNTTMSQNKSKPLMWCGNPCNQERLAIITEEESYLVISPPIATELEHSSNPLATVSVGTVLPHKYKYTKQITSATAQQRSFTPSVVLSSKIKGKSKPNVPMVMADERERKENHKNVQDVNYSPRGKKACKLANWIDDFCQGTGWDRDEAMFLPL